MSECHIGVFGAGIVGLNTSLQLQQLLRNAHITVIADSFNEETTSDGAAGLFEPANYFAGPTPQITHEWIGESYNIYKNYMNNSGCGIKEIYGYLLSKHSYEKTRNKFLERLVKFKEVDADELKSIPHFNWKYGSYFPTLLIESRLFLPWAMKRFISNGGSVKKGRLNRFSETENFGKFDVIVNCTGLGARELCGDERLLPIRGQVFKVDAPWLKNFYYGDKTTYIIPGFTAATLGGVREYASWDREVNKYESQGIWERCTEIVPQLSTAPVIREWVGLRPHRDVVRVEPEIINGLKVVHNYGHGGYGVTSAPGTAKTAADYVVDLLRSTTAKY